jgi:D-galactarolactone isomerase
MTCAKGLSENRRECTMSEPVIGRRTFLAGTAVAALGALRVDEGFAQEKFEVPNSAGTEPPRLKAPPGACDCHHHIYDTRFPGARSTGLISAARVSDYRLLQRRLGLTRSIVVTPGYYPTTFAGNLVTTDALAEFGPNERGVAIVASTITDAELKTLADAGVRGIRFSVANANGSSADISAATAEAIETLAKRVDALGWHVQFNVAADQIVAAEALLNRLPSPIVFDHMGHMPQPAGTAHPAYAIVRRLIDKGRTWVKLSVTYDSSKIGPPTYADVNKVGEAYVVAAPERMLWGSNWPHPNETTKPDDAALFDLLAAWAPSEATRRRILVENPEILYGFAKAA